MSPRSRGCRANHQDATPRLPLVGCRIQISRPGGLVEGKAANAPSPLVGDGFSSWRETSLAEKGEGPVPGGRGQVPHPVSLSSFLAKRNRPLPSGRGGRRVSECGEIPRRGGCV